MLTRGKQLFDRTAAHIRDQIVVRYVRDLSGRYAFAVAQDGKRIGDLPYFFQEMADVNDTYAFRAQSPDLREQAANVVARQAACRFIHQDNFRSCRDRTAYLDDLL